MAENLDPIELEWDTTSFSQQYVIVLQSSLSDAPEHINALAISPVYFLPAILASRQVLLSALLS